MNKPTRNLTPSPLAAAIIAEVERERNRWWPPTISRDCVAIRRDEPANTCQGCTNGHCRASSP